MCTHTKSQSEFKFIFLLIVVLERILLKQKPWSRRGIFLASWKGEGGGWGGGWGVGRKEMVKGDMDIEDHIFLCKSPVEPGEVAFK